MACTVEHPAFPDLEYSTKYKRGVLNKVVNMFPRTRIQERENEQTTTKLLAVDEESGLCSIEDIAPK